MRRNAVLLTLVAALLLPFTVAAAPASSGATLGERPATVHADLRAQLGTLEAEGRLDVIVSTWDRAGLAAVRDVGASGRELRTMPIALARLTGDQIAALAQDRRVRSLWPDEQHELFLDEGTTMVGADRVAQDLAVDGTGVIVGVIDTGIDTTHTDLDGGKVRGNFEIVDSPFEGGDILVDLPDTDDHGHGTHVASTIAGLDDDGGNVMDGVAPGAELYGYSINVGASVLTSLALVSFDDLLARRLAGEPIVAASNSWGGGEGTYSPDDPLAISTRALFENGIVPVFAAGNSGPGLETASNQCTMPWTFCVGAITKGRTLAGFSSRGRTPAASTEERPDGETREIQAGNHDVGLGQAAEVGVYRPNVSAPGVDIEAACARLACGMPDGYQFMSGTSMATPHVSGVIALVQAARLQAAGELASADTVTRLVEGSANPLPGYELWETGTGEVDALEATRVAAQPVAEADLAVPVANAGATTVGGDGEKTSEHAGPVLPNGWQTGEGTFVDTFEVDGDTGGFLALLTWPNPTDNIYLNLYAPGLVPGEDAPTAQSAGLLDGTGPYLRGYRDLEVHFPEPGTWTLEVLGRVNAPTDVKVEIFQRDVQRPATTITSVTDGTVEGTTTAGDVIAPTDAGLTRAAVAGTAEPLDVGQDTTFYLHSNAGSADSVGDLTTDGYPFATFDASEPSTPASKVSEVTMLANPEFAGNPLTAYWRGQVAGAITGDVVLDAFLSTPTGAAFTTTLTATLFAVDTDRHGTSPVAEVLGRATTEVEVPAVPAPVRLTIPGVVTGDVSARDVVLQLTSTYVNSGHVQVWHDSTIHPSSLTVPVLAAGSDTGVVLPPSGVSVTDGVGGGANVSWSEVAAADGYVVERASSPAGPWDATTVTGTTLEDATVPARVATYYRVRTLRGDAASPASGIAVATPIDDAPFVELRFGDGPWELATLAEDGSWTYGSVSGTSETCTSRAKGDSPSEGKGRNGRGGPPVTCETSVTYAPLPTGEIQARSSRWFATSPPAFATAS